MSGADDAASRDPSAGTDEARWRNLALKVLKGAPFDTLRSSTYDGLTIEPLYKAATPDTRPLIGRAGNWQVLARIDHPDPAAANEQALVDLEGGATGLHLVFAGSQGSYGFGIADPEHLDTVLAGVHLEAGCPVEIDLGPVAKDIARLFADFVDKRRIDPARIELHIGIDPLGDIAARGAAAAPWSEIAPRFAREVGAFAATGLGGTACVADARRVHAAGGSEAQELAFAVAAALAYWRALEAGGIDLDAGRRLIAFRLAADADQFLTIAKMRALRRLWAAIEAAAGLKPLPVRLHAETAWRMATRRDPYVNLLRATIAAFAAGIGGADAISVLPFIQALGLPDPFARRLARNAQLILLEESHLGKVADAAGGAGSFEALTEQLAANAWSLLQQIEALGTGDDRGLYAALVTNSFQSMVAQVRRVRMDHIARRKDPITGTSEFPDLARPAPPVLEQLATVITTPARTGGFRFEPLALWRASIAYETLRDAADAWARTKGEPPRVFLANLGPIAAFAARASFAANLFEAGEFVAIATDGFATPEATVAAFTASGAPFACLCSSDALYAERAVVTAHALTAAGAKAVYLAGRPAELETELRDAGIVDFLYAGCDALAVLTGMQSVLGS